MVVVLLRWFGDGGGFSKCLRDLYVGSFILEMVGAWIAL